MFGLQKKPGGIFFGFNRIGRILLRPVRWLEKGIDGRPNELASSVAVAIAVAIPISLLILPTKQKETFTNGICDSDRYDQAIEAFVSDHPLEHPIMKLVEKEQGRKPFVYFSRNVTSDPYLTVLAATKELGETIQSNDQVYKSLYVGHNERVIIVAFDDLEVMKSFGQATDWNGIVPSGMTKEGRQKWVKLILVHIFTNHPRDLTGIGF